MSKLRVSAHLKESAGAVTRVNKSLSGSGSPVEITPARSARFGSFMVFSGVAEARAVSFECQQQWRIACLSSYERDALKACCYLHLQLLWNLFRGSGAHASEMGGLRWEDMDLQEEPRRTPLEKN